LSAYELLMLDGFEGVKSADESYASDGCAYHRQDVLCLVGEAEEVVTAVLYVKADCSWRGPPSKQYLEACARNVGQFWAPATVEVRDENGTLRDV